jgi:RNA polymerase sigma-70 factor (ECF subfamily)
MDRRMHRRGKPKMSVTLTMEMPLEAAPGSLDEEAALVAASRGGDPDAFSELVRRHQRRVFRLAGRFFRRPEDVEEAAQETFLAAWSRLGTYKARAPFEHWLTRVCLNLCYEKLRKRHPAEQPLDGESHLGTTGSDPTAAIEAERLLGVLEPADRFVLLLLYGEGWTVAEIADRLGWTQVNVKVRAHRARKKLRRLLEQKP